MRCNPFLLSQYHDGRLPAWQRLEVERHVQTCKQCSGRLRQYQDISLGIRSLPQEESPRSLWPKLLEGVRQRPIPRSKGFYRLALAAALLLAVIASTLFLSPLREQEQGDIVVLAAYPANNEVGVPVDASVQLEFNQVPEKQTIGQGVSIEPFVEIVADWEKNTLVITPREKLQSGTTYTVTVPLTSGPAATQEERKVFTTTFTTAPAEEDSRKPAPPLAQAAPSPFPTAMPTATAPPAAVPTSTVQAPLRCAIWPVRGFGKIYSENPNVARALGCALEPEKGVYLAEQPFERGYSYWRKDTRQIYVIMDTGRWAVYPDTWNEGDPSPSLGTAPAAGLEEPTRGFGKVWRERKEVRDALGWAISPERGLNGAVEPFERGAMVWSDSRIIFVLFSDGTWLRFADTFEG